MHKSDELSLEQEFKLARYKKQLNKLSHDESQKYLIATLKQMMIKDNIIKYFMKNRYSYKTLGCVFFKLSTSVLFQDSLLSKSLFAH